MKNVVYSAKWGWGGGMGRLTLTILVTELVGGGKRTGLALTGAASSSAVKLGSATGMLVVLSTGGES